MKLLDFLWQLNKRLPKGEEGPETKETQRAGPTNVLQWANENKAELKGGAWAGDLILKMHKALLDRTHVAKTAQLLIDPSAGYAVLYGSEDAYAEAINSSDQVEPTMYYIDDFKAGFKNLCGFALGAQQWAYPGCAWYYTLSKQDVSDFLTKDFQTKHVNTTDDMKGARKVAQIRGAQVADRQGVTAFGRIVTARSGGIEKASLGALKDEIKSRQSEFKDTYTALSEYYAAHFLDIKPPKKSFAAIDHVTFITKKKYPMHEFEHGKGGQDDLYISFSVSCSEDGKSWAVHHLAGTSAGRTPKGTALNGLGINTTDGATSAKMP